MDLKFAVLLAFIADGISVWLLMRMSGQVGQVGQVGQDRIGKTKTHIAAIVGTATDIDLVFTKDCPFNSEDHTPGFAYEF